MLSKLANLFGGIKDSFTESDSKANALPEGVIPKKPQLQTGEIMVLEAGDLKGKQFQVIKELGQGGFGIVYSVAYGAEKFACKILDLYHKQPPEWETYIARFKRGFKVGQIDSPYLVRSYHESMYLGNPCVLMHLCEGGSLADNVEKYHSEEAFTPLALKVLTGLKTLHSNGVIHRDIKPENILFDEKGTPKLTDFDISVFQDKRGTIRNWRGYVKEVWCTAVYAAPELYNKQQTYDIATPAIDMFAFGVTMYELLTKGKYPFGGFEEYEKNPVEYYQKVGEGTFTPLEQYRPDLSKKWTDLINGCFHPNPEQRINNPDTILNQFPNIDKLVSGNIIEEIKQSGDWVLIVKNGEEIDKSYNLSQLLTTSENQLLKIGRLDTDNPNANDINIVETLSRYISRRHATLKFEDESWWIRDGQEIETSWKPSMNGTTSTNGPVESESFQKINLNDIIIIAGDTTLKLENQ